MVVGKMIRVLVVDDSSFMRKMISEMLESEKGIEVVDTASRGLDAIEKVRKLRPDVTLDIRMPDISGLDVLNEVMEKFPTPCVMVSAYTKAGSVESVLSYEYGAVEVIPKPSGEISLNIRQIRDKLIEAVKVAAEVDIRKVLRERKGKVVKVSAKSDKELVVIGASTGGPYAVNRIMSEIPRNFPVPIIIAQHMPGKFTEVFAERLDRRSQLKVKEAEQGEVMRKGVAYVVPGDYNLEVKRRENDVVFRLRKKKEKELCSIDTALKSAADVFDGKVVGVVLTGMGNDGLEGVSVLRRAGGVSVVQDEKSSVVFGMPREIIENKDADFVLSLDKIAEKVSKLLGKS